MEERRGRSRSVKRIKASSGPNTSDSARSMSRSRSRTRSASGYRSVNARGPAYLNPAVLSKKGMDTDISLSPVIATTSTNASSFVLNLCQSGNGSWNRQGRKIIPHSLRLVGTFEINYTPTFATGAMTQNAVRMVVVWDQQPSSGTIPTFDTIFGITAQDGTESCPDVTCPPRYDNMDRFKVLHDRFYNAVPAFVPAFGTAPTNAIQLHFDEFISLKGKCKETVFSGQSAPMTIADISTGAIYLYMRTQYNQASTTVECDGIARLRYWN